MYQYCFGVGQGLNKEVSRITGRSLMYMFERPKRVNIIGRVRYPEDMNARFVIDSQFDDCWKSIGWLWVIVCALVINNCLTKKKKCVGWVIWDYLLEKY